MIHRPLPASQVRRRDAIFARTYRKILVVTQEILDARAIAEDDAELTVADLSIDAALGAALAYDALYWSDPEAFAARSAAYMSEFVVRCAAISVADEVERILDERSATEIGRYVDPVCWPRPTRRIPGFHIIQPA